MIAAKYYRCKRPKPDGGIVDGCGWQGAVTGVLQCPVCGSTCLRDVNLDWVSGVATPPRGVPMTGCQSTGAAGTRASLICRVQTASGRVPRATPRRLSPRDLSQRPTGLDEDPAARKAAPMARGLLDYFPNALAYVSHVSKVGNDQHNPGQPMHWAFDKSTDEPDCILRHLAQRGTIDTDGLRHTGKVAWRALALLERELLEANPDLKPGLSVKGR